MPEAPIVSRVRWWFENAPGSDVATLRCRDDVTQRDYSIDLPLHTLPSLAAGLRDLIDAHPDDFPATLEHRFS